MLRYIVLYSAPCEGMWPLDGQGDDDYPLPTFNSREAAQEWATKKGLRSPKGFRDESEILAVEV